MATAQELRPAEPDEFSPWVPDQTEFTEVTPGAIVLGTALGLVFAASGA